MFDCDCGCHFHIMDEIYDDGVFRCPDCETEYEEIDDDA